MMWALVIVLYALLGVLYWAIFYAHGERERE